MLVHIFANTPHHYYPMRSFFTTQCYIQAKQVFWVKMAQQGNKEDVDADFWQYKTNVELFDQLAQLPNNAQIIFHGLFDIHIWKKLLLLPIAKRCSCVLWGAELYRHGKSNRNVKEYIAQWLHAILLNRFANVFTLTPGDADLAKRYLKCRNVQVLPYPLIGLNVVADDTTKSAGAEQGIKILVGNSAAASNEHSYALKQLAHLADANVEIIMPLNYAGEANYIERLIREGRALFGDKFKPITTMLTKVAYDQLLREVDLAVFAHQRQQGLYVAYAMLLMGKPLFLRASTSSYKNLANIGFSVLSLDELKNISSEQLLNLTANINKNDQRLMQENFTEQALAPKWSNTLNKLKAVK